MLKDRGQGFPISVRLKVRWCHFLKFAVKVAGVVRDLVLRSVTCDSANSMKSGVMQIILTTGLVHTGWFVNARAAPCEASYRHDATWCERSYTFIQVTGDSRGFTKRWWIGNSWCSRTIL